jgi:hypothetical protein
LAFYTPLSQLFSIRIVQVVFVTVLSASWAGAIAYGVEQGRAVYPNARFAWVIIGTLFGMCGSVVSRCAMLIIDSATTSLGIGRIGRWFVGDVGPKDLARYGHRMECRVCDALSLSTLDNALACLID